MAIRYSNQRILTVAIMYTDGIFHDARWHNASTRMQAFNYGTAAFEGLKACYDRKTRRWFLFRPDQYYARLKRSAAAIGIDLAESFERFVAIVATLIRRNNIRSDVYIRPLVYRNERGVGLTRPSGYGFSIFIQSMPPAPAHPLSSCIVPQRRPADGSSSFKLAGNYVMSFLAHGAAIQKGFNIGIMRSATGFVSEASAMNLFFVRDGRLFTPSLACGPLNGITRKSIIELANCELGITVNEGRYHTDRLLLADELFLTGTGSGISPVQQFERRKYKLNSPNLLAPKLSAVYDDATHGRLSKLTDWLVMVK
jgi:branched-chain amino acid aminotransferase